VLTVFPENGPAAARRRWLVLLLTAAPVVLVAAGGCGSRTGVDTQECVAVARRVLVEVGPSGSPEVLRLETRIAASEAAARLAAEALMPRRYDERLELANAELIATAHRVATDWRRQRGRDEDLWQASYQSAALHVATAEGLSHDTGMGRGERSAVARARTRLELARSVAAAGRYEEAAATAAEASGLADWVSSRWQERRERFREPSLRRLWNRQVSEVLDRSRIQREPAIIVDKLKHALYLVRGGLLVKQYPVDLGSNGLEPKLHSGDLATPEGHYFVSQRKDVGHSRYHRALLIDYPNDRDWRRYREARADGRVGHTVGIGSLIEVHGNGGTGRDWTEGCIALSDFDMDVVFKHARVGTPVTIVGTTTWGPER
jgi:hypothetical protein